MPRTPERAQEQGHGDAELAVRATSCPWETLCGGQSYLSCGDGCVSGNAILIGAPPLVRPFLLAFLMIHLSVSEMEATTELASGVTSTLTGQEAPHKCSSMTSVMFSTQS